VVHDRAISFLTTHQRLRTGFSEDGPERVAESPRGPSIGAHHLSTLYLLKVGKDVEACQAVESISLSTLCTLLISRLRGA